LTRIEQIHHYGLGQKPLYIGSGGWQAFEGTQAKRAAKVFALRKALILNDIGACK
jgi:hypothetical protein